MEEDKICWKCSGKGMLRRNKFVDGKYTFGSMECDNCNGSGIEPDSNPQQLEPRKLKQGGECG